MKMFLIVFGVIIGAFVFFVLVMTGIGAMLPVAHVASRSEYFPVGTAALYDMAVAQFHRTNDGSFAIVEQAPPDRFVTAIVKKRLPFGGRWTFEFVPAGEGTKLTITENGEVYNPFFRFVSRYIMGHTKSIDDFLAALKAETNGQGR